MRFMGKTSLYLLLGVVCFAALGGCRRQGTHARAAARQEAAGNEALRTWVYESCKDDRPPGTACGVISPKFFSQNSLARLEQERCRGVASDVCARAIDAEWIDRMLARYPEADARVVLRHCEKNPGPCSDPTHVERVWLKTHNKGVLARLRAKTKAIRDARDADLVEMNERAREALARGLQNASQALQRREVLVASCRTYGDCPMGFRCDGRVCVR
jgi:hypothetical protein